jgi:hypothetical protein
MAKKFYVRLTLFFLDGTVSETIADIVDAITLDRALKTGEPLPGNDQVTDLHYTTLRELPNDDQP